jgi:hypothetical protein
LSSPAGSPPAAVSIASRERPIQKYDVRNQHTNHKKIPCALSILRNSAQDRAIRIFA